MKKCKCSKILLPDECFNKNKSKSDGLNTICKVCSRKRSKEYYENNREEHKASTRERKRNIKIDNRKKMIEYKLQNPCIHCGEKEPICLDFHHIHGKDFNISERVANSYKWEDIIKEIKRCVILCANCHRKVHSGIIDIRS